jgi:hypothetical protein
VMLPLAVVAGPHSSRHRSPSDDGPRLRPRWWWRACSRWCPGASCAACFSGRKGRFRVARRTLSMVVVRIT